MKGLLFFTVLAIASCTTDVSIMKADNQIQHETGSAIDTSSLDREPSSEPDSQISDLTIGFGKIHFRQIACPACVGEPGEFDITAELKLHSPTSGNYTEHLTPVSSCTTNLHDTHVSIQPLLSSENAYFNDIVLPPSGQGTWANTYMYENQYSRNTFYKITTEHGTVDNAFQTIEGFDQINPYTLLWVDPSYAFEAVISKSGTTFTWAPVLPATQFEIIIAVYTPDGSQFLGAVSCMENDSGMMFIPGDYFQNYSYWSLASVHFLRHKVMSTPAQELGGQFQSHMIWEVVGTAHVE